MSIPVSDLSAVGIVLTVAGFVVAMAAILVNLKRHGEGQARGGAVVIVGVFPMMFRTDRQSAKILLILSIVLVAVLTILFLFQVFF